MSARGWRRRLQRAAMIFVDATNACRRLARWRDAYEAAPGAVAVQLVAHLRRAAHHRLIFDGPTPEGLRADAFQICRWAAPHSADDSLLSELAARPTAETILVTDDRALAGAARRHDCHVCDVATWWHWAERPAQLGPADLDDEAPLSDAEVAYWRELFGEEE